MKSAEDDNGDGNITSAASMITGGLALESEYSGAGGGEIGITPV